MRNYCTFSIAESEYVTKGHVNFWSFDVLKIFLAFLVILRHCAQSFFAPDSLFHIIVVNILSPIAVPSFFALSSFLLFRKPVTFQRLLHQIKRILKLYIVWSLVYLPLTLFFNLRSGEMLVKTFLLTYLQNFLFSGSYYHLWFLPALAFSLLFVWLLNKHVNLWIQCIILTILFALGTVAENFAFTFPKSIALLYETYCQFFLTPRNGLFFGCLFVWIGKYFSENFNRLITKSSKKCHIFILPVFLGLIVEGFILSHIHGNFVVNMLFSAVPFVFLLLQLEILRSTSTRCKYRTDSLRAASTFAFCFHPIAILAVSLLEKVGIVLSSYTATVAVVIICAVTTFLYIKISSKIRILQLLV